MIFEYKGKLYPDYIKNGNAIEHIENTAKHFCQGSGLDIGGYKGWTLKGAIPINIEDPILEAYTAEKLPEYKKLDFIFSSHCLEHLDDPINTLQYWKGHLREGGCLFLYLPHPEMEHWRPGNCKKHKNIWQPFEMEHIIKKLGFKNVIRSERDLYWSFCVVGWN